MSIPLTLNLRSIVPSNFSVTTMYYKKDDKSAFFPCQLWNMYLVIFFLVNIFTRKIALWCFCIGEMSEKNHNFFFLIKNLVNLQNEMEKKPRYNA